MDRSGILLAAHVLVAAGLAAVGALEIAGGALLGGGINFVVAAVVVGVGYYLAKNERSAAE